MIALCGALWVLEVPVRGSTNWYGDNLGMLQSAADPDSSRIKRYVTTLYHTCRAQVPRKVLMHTKVRTDDSFTKMRTKALEVGNIEYLGRMVFAGPFHSHKGFVLQMGIKYNPLLKCV